jgi:hypothetical protein
VTPSSIGSRQAKRSPRVATVVHASAASVAGSAAPLSVVGPPVDLHLLLNSGMKRKICQDGARFFRWLEEERLAKGQGDGNA